MKRIDFYIYDELKEQIDQMISLFGFRSRAEFFRYTAIDFIRREGKRIPSDETLKKHTKAIQRVKSGRGRNIL